VPVAVVGTFAVMAAMGFSLNNLTLFGLVLAIGIVVDDAIVVVEAVEHHIENGLPPRDATIKAMEQVSGPVIAIGLVLCAVFVPCAFISGIIGQFFRQFALTIAVSTLISAFNSLTLSPALAALLLKPRAKGTYEALPRLAFVLAGAYAVYASVAAWVLPHLDIPDWAGSAAAITAGALAGWALGWPLNVILGTLFGAFNRLFDQATGLYTRAVGFLLVASVPVLLIYCGLLYLTYESFLHTPAGFIPSQDKGFLLVNVQLPDAASSERTRYTMDRIEAVAKATPGVKHTVAVSGQSVLMNANAPNFGAMYLMLDDFHHRADPELSGPNIAVRLQAALQEAAGEALVNVFEPPPVDGLGTAGGFKIMIQERGDGSLPGLQNVADNIIAAEKDEGGRMKDEKDPAHPSSFILHPSSVQGMFTSFRANTPWLYLEIDREQAKRMGVSMTEIFSTLQVYLGSLYVNDFNRFGRTWQVNVQGAADFRKQIDDLKQLKVRNERGEMVPFAGMARVRDVSGPVMVMRYNMYPAAAINGAAAPGVSSGQAIAAAEQLTKDELLQSMHFEWTELALLQLQTGNTAMLAFALAVVLVFLVLAAQYESWSLPLAVILVVPMCLLFSVAGVLFARLDINIFTQVGFVVLVGLACKNAILIVEFAKAQREAGESRYDATLQACKLRLRPIIMTSFAFILGVVPLMVSQGAGAEMRQTLGIAVFAGMLGVTLFGIFLTPVFFYTIQWLTEIAARSSRATGKLVAEAPDARTSAHVS
jgi:hydrophobe/amphiphile efflux-1 (HAE1) family protein